MFSKFYSLAYILDLWNFYLCNWDFVYSNIVLSANIWKVKNSPPNCRAAENVLNDNRNLAQAGLRPGKQKDGSLNSAFHRNTVKCACLLGNIELMDTVYLYMMSIV